MKKINRFPILIMALCLCGGCGQTPLPDPAEHSFFAMDTYITMSAYGGQAEEALTEAETLVRRLESQLSVTDESSEIYAANHSAGDSTIISEDTEELIAFALQMAQETGGALDPTIYPVLTAWGFTTEAYQVPAREELDRLLALVGYEQIGLEGISVTVPEGVQLDLGAVAKGYTSGRVAALLKGYGVTSALINLGGNVQAIGGKPDGAPWRIGVRNPFTDGNLGVLEVEDQAVVTSGGYERYFTDEDGKVYWHILDPATGSPAQSGLVSVTVMSPDGKRCDALSTALFVMGRKKAEEYWREHGDFEMLLVTDERDIYLTEGLENIFSLNDSAADMPFYIIH